MGFLKNIKRAVKSVVNPDSLESLDKAVGKARGKVAQAQADLHTASVALDILVSACNEAPSATAIQAVQNAVTHERSCRAELQTAMDKHAKAQAKALAFKAAMAPSIIFQRHAEAVAALAAREALEAREAALKEEALEAREAALKEEAFEAFAAALKEEAFAAREAAVAAPAQSAAHPVDAAFTAIEQVSAQLAEQAAVTQSAIDSHQRRADAAAELRALTKLRIDESFEASVKTSLQAQQEQEAERERLALIKARAEETAADRSARKAAQEAVLARVEETRAASAKDLTQVHWVPVNSRFTRGAWIPSEFLGMVGGHVRAHVKWEPYKGLGVSVKHPGTPSTAVVYRPHVEGAKALATEMLAERAEVVADLVGALGRFETNCALEEEARAAIASGPPLPAAEVEAFVQKFARKYAAT